MEDYEQSKAIHSIYHLAAGARLLFVARQMIKITGRNVLNGPFAGISLYEKESWAEGNLAAKILGCYEMELVPAIEKAIAKKPEIVINIGAGDGYYSLGLAKRLPDSLVYAFDINTEAQEICIISAVENDLLGQITIAGECTNQKLIELASTGKKTLIVMDCEGAEINLLNQETVASLRNCDIIVECHDFGNPQITPTLLANMAGRFTTETITQTGRNPMGFPFLNSFSDLDRWLMVCEFRPEAMHWLACWGNEN